MSPRGEEYEEAILAISRAIHDLGNGNAATPMGAIEAHGVAMREAARRLAEAISDAGAEIALALNHLATAITDKESS